MNADRNFQTSTVRTALADQTMVDLDEAAQLRAFKELGEYYPIARKHFGNNVQALLSEVKSQLNNFKQEEVRTLDGVIVTGLLDLTKFGLTKEQAEHQALFLKAERESGKYADSKREAMMHAVKELGPEFLDKAIERVGNLQDIALEAESQLKKIPLQERRNGGLLIIGLLELQNLGLTPIEAEERNGQIAHMKANPQRYPTVTVAKSFSVGVPDTNILSKTTVHDENTLVKSDPYGLKGIGGGVTD